MDRADHGPDGHARGGGAHMTALIEARDLTLSFGETPALRGASLAVEAGEVFAVMGPSGSGKSTLLHCLAGILTPDSGEVHFDGHRIDTMNVYEIVDIFIDISGRLAFPAGIVDRNYGTK